MTDLLLMSAAIIIKSAACERDEALHIFLRAQKALRLSFVPACAAHLCSTTVYVQISWACTQLRYLPSRGLLDKS